MPSNFLHELPDFPGLLRILEKETGILPQLIEKDYWIMHVLYGLNLQGFDFVLKGGTSLSKGFGIIDRFSEDIDIHITPPKLMGVNANVKNNKTKAVASRRNYYDWLAHEIKIRGIHSVIRDTTFDNTTTYNSGGIRLLYETNTEDIQGIKDGILLEAGFDTVTPNEKRTITSWAFEKALGVSEVEVVDNRAVNIACYHPGYTLVEKLQTITRKFRQEQETNVTTQNLMRQYYDVYQLLSVDSVQAFIGTEAYFQHKDERFKGKDKEIAIAENEAFLLNDPAMRAAFTRRYEATKNLYYKGQPPFEALLSRIRANTHRL